ncbi:MAG: helix-turn-helix domain-containing protein [Firmicutes bacterium]|jgi:predicted DNA-binding transcriptional regulator AlpA|nr:helix-turn-helix domain-containing protein [Bacillota bacterium]
MNRTIQPTAYKCLEDIPATFGPAELAGIMGISRNKAYDLANAPDFPKLRIGRRIVISKKHFTAWLDEKMQVEEPF